MLGVTSMFVLFLLCTFLQTPWGKPLPLLGTSFEVTANTTGTTACECPAVPDHDGVQQLRSVYNIVQSCLFTIFACVWTSIHPNLHGPRDSWWARTKRRLITTLNAVIAPELVLVWALDQRFAAKTIADLYNKKFKTLEETKTSIWGKFKQLFKRLPKSTSRHGAKVRQPWTITHGFFIQMGGFVLYENKVPTEALTYDRLAALLREKAIKVPTVTERELQDRSKGDTISKGVVVLQTAWFVLQCIVRAVQHLPLSELEVLTLAFAVMNAAIYVAWWSKPQGVDTAICIPLKRLKNRAFSLQPLSPSSSHTDYQQSNDDQPLSEPDEHTDEEDGWLRGVLQEDRKRHNAFVWLLVCLPFISFLSILRPFFKMIGSHKTQKKPRMPMFYSADDHDTTLPGYIACAVGILFGAIHLLGWSLEFPLPRDRMLWHISAVLLTSAPFMVILVSVLHDQELFTVLQEITLLISLVLVPFYIAARFIVIFIAFKAILHPPHDVLLDVSWTRYIPHF